MKSNFAELNFLESNIEGENINSLKYLSNDELLYRTESLVRTERKIMHLVLKYILEIMDRKLYAELGYDSMYTFLIKKYGYSEASALRRIDAAKLLKSIPSISERFESGTLNLSQAVLLQKCLESEARKGEAISNLKTEEILNQLQSCNGFETRQVLAQEFDLPIKIQDIVRPQKDESVRLEVTFTKEQYEELKMAKNFVSHIAHNGSWAEVITLLAKKLNQTKMGKPNQPVTALNSNPDTASNSDKSRSSFESKKITQITTAREPESSHKITPYQKSLNHKRRPIPVQIKRQLLTQSQNICEYQSPQGHRCGSAFQLQIDHIAPVVWGGKSSAENLRVLCRTHNLLSARQMGLSLA